MTTPTAHDFHTQLPAQVAQRGRTAGSRQKLPARFNPARPETVVLDCGDGEVWVLPRWLFADTPAVDGTVEVAGSGWSATAHRWNEQMTHVLLQRDGAEPVALYVASKALAEFEATLKALTADYLTRRVAGTDWNAELAALTGGARCPTCHEPVPGLLSGCRKRECLRAELDADAAIDFPAKED